MELFSLIAAFAILFVAIPALASGSRHGSWLFRAAAAFVSVSLFFRAALMFAGIVGAHFHGMVVALWAAWIVILFVAGWGWDVGAILARGQSTFLRILQALETESVSFNPRWPRPSRAAVLFCLLAFVTLLHRAWYPLHNLRFGSIETYSRALDLQKFLHRDALVAGGAELILTPLGIFSGLYADSVIRFSGPLFSTLLVLATGLCAFRYLRSANAALAAAALMALRPVILGAQHPGEISSAEFAAVYWVLGLTFLGRSGWLAVSAFCAGILISWSISPAVPIAIFCIALAGVLAFLSSIAPLRLASMPSGGLTAAAMLLLLFDCRAAAPDGPLEYESAARASRAIATQFPRKEWLIVSPVHELAFTYGRGWHYELLDFVSSHSAGQITPREFAFPYDVRDIFVFVEKNPLRPTQVGSAAINPAALDLTQTMDRSVLAYNTGLGRASIEFQAGALVSAYALNHSGVSIFFQDERLVVFHLNGKRALAKSGA